MKLWQLINCQYMKNKRLTYLMHIQWFKDACNGCLYSFTKTFEDITLFFQFIFTSLSYATLLLLISQLINFQRTRWMTNESDGKNFNNIIDENILCFAMAFFMQLYWSYCIWHLAVCTNTLRFDHSLYFLRYFFSILLLSWCWEPNVFM